MLDYKTMEKEVVFREDLNKKIFVVQGDLDNEKLKRISDDEITGYILVTGNVNFTKENTTVHCGLIVMGNFEAIRASIHGNLQVYGGNPPKAERLIVRGDFLSKPDDEIKRVMLVGGRIFC